MQDLRERFKEKGVIQNKDQFIVRLIAQVSLLCTGLFRGDGASLPLSERRVFALQMCCVDGWARYVGVISGGPSCCALHCLRSLLYHVNNASRSWQ